MKSAGEQPREELTLEIFLPSSEILHREKEEEDTGIKKQLGQQLDALLGKNRFPARREGCDSDDMTCLELKTQDRKVAGVWCLSERHW